MPKIVAIHELTTEQQQKIKEIAPDYELLVSKAKELNPPPSIREAEILIGWSRSLQEDVLSTDSQLKWDSSMVCRCG
jgi:hypothetical protein